MSKSVLVMDTPEKGCISCLIGRNDSNCRITRIYCPFAGETAFDEDAETIPDWCPLRLFPKKKRIDGYWRGEHGYGWIQGWNACIDEITGGGVDGEINT